jgi:hypothetical protein
MFSKHTHAVENNVRFFEEKINKNKTHKLQKLKIVNFNLKQHIDTRGGLNQLRCIIQETQRDPISLFSLPDLLESWLQFFFVCKRAAVCHKCVS